MYQTMSSPSKDHENPGAAFESYHIVASSTIEDIAVLQDQNARLKERCRQQIDRITQLEEQLEQQQISNDKELSQRGATLTRTNGEVARLRKEITVATEELDRLRSEIDKLNHDMTVRTQSERQLKKENTEKTKEIQRLQNDNDSMHQQLDSLQAEVKRIKEENIRLELLAADCALFNEKLQEYEEKLDKLLEENTKLKLDLEKSIRDNKKRGRRQLTDLGQFEMIPDHSLQLQSYANLNQQISTISIDSVVYTPPRRQPSITNGAAESMAIFRIKELELKEDELINKLEESETKLQKSEEAFKKLENQSMCDRERIARLERELEATKKEHESALQKVNLLLIEKVEVDKEEEEEMITPDDNNNKNQDSVLEVQSIEMTTTETTIADKLLSSPQPSKRAKNEKKKRRKWYRFFVCISAATAS